jgi:folate-binding protein YgfZ
MSELGVVHLGNPALLEFRGPDAVRFLNGQLTQDVRKVVGSGISLPSCVTDAKGKLQFRVTLAESDDAGLWVAGLDGSAEDLEMRLTRYLIADDVEVTDLTGKYSLCHLIGPEVEPPAGVLARKSNRYGVAGWDWWFKGSDSELPANAISFGAEELEALRIRNGVPAWGTELVEGMLPPEASLEATDISYQKGCYIGQEVISRIKSAGKVNKRLTRFAFDGEIPVAPGPLENGAGEITSVSPVPENGRRYALGYVKRVAGELFYRTAAGEIIPVGLP